MSDELSENGTGSSGKSEDIPHIPELDRYIFRPDPYESGAVPRRLIAEEVARYLIGNVKPEIQFSSAIRVEDVAKFYETFEVVAHLKTILDRREQDELARRRSMALVRVIAYLGNEEDRKFARQYYEYLGSRAETADEFIDLTYVLDSLGPESDGGFLRKLVNARTAGLSNFSEDDYEGRLAFLEFEERVKGQVDRAERAQGEKEKLISIGDRRKRLEEETKAYLTTHYGFLEYLQPWAARRINRESWSKSVSEQSIRPESEPLKLDVAATLRSFISEIDNIPHLDDDDKISIRIRLLRGVRFFNGETSDEEEEFLAQFRGKQLDLLANEGFQLN